MSRADRFEREAHRVSHRVLRTVDPTPGGRNPRLSDRSLVDVSAVVAAPQLIRPPTAVAGVLSSSGKPLDDGTREFFERRLGRDFSQVRIHADHAAARSARAMGAMAYTVGLRIVFAPGRYAPERSDGLRLLAHELTHVVQQNGSHSRSFSVLQKAPDPQEHTTYFNLSSKLAGVRLQATYRPNEPPSGLSLYPWQRVVMTIFTGMHQALEIADERKGEWLIFEFDLGWTLWLRTTIDGDRELKLDPLTQESFGELLVQLRPTKAPASSVSIELADAPEATTPHGRVFLWLVSNRQRIVSAEQNHSVDRRAIAGAIAWEALENEFLPSAHVEAASAAGAPRFSGPGKVHYKEARVEEGAPAAKVVEDLGRLPRRTKEERRDYLATPEGAITYIAVIMKEIADMASGVGYYLNCDPPMLTTFYNAWDLDAVQRLFHDPRNPRRPPDPLTPNDMGSWVRANNLFLEKAVGRPADSLCTQPRGY